MSIKIQLNSLEALERLIGGDSGVEIEIRNSIVQEFTKRHLKHLLTERVEGIMEGILERELMQLCASSRDSWGRSSTVLTDTAKELITKRVDYEVSNAIDTAVTKYLCDQSDYLQKMVKAYVDSGVESAARAYLPRVSEIQEKLKQAIESLPGVKK